MLAALRGNERGRGQRGTSATARNSQGPKTRAALQRMHGRTPLARAPHLDGLHAVALALGALEAQHNLLGRLGLRAGGGWEATGQGSCVLKAWAGWLPPVNWQWVAFRMPVTIQRV